MNRRTFLVSATSFAHAAPSSFEEATTTDLQKRFESRTLTSEALIRTYLERIARIDHAGPALHSVIEINPDALTIARSLDQERQAKGARGPLHGIPVLLKDNIETADRMQTTAGSLALLGAARPARDALLVRRLRAVGAVILGKTNLSEWANFRSSHSVSGWSARGGQTRNPYALDRNPCGSSSGSGVAVSANLCAMAVGTETDGSVVCPASMCGIVGIKPTLGSVSGAGIIPIAHSQDTAGPMARSVTDAALLLGVLSGKNYLPSLNIASLRGARIGVVRQYFNIGPAVTAIMESSLAAMREAGAILIDPADLSTFEEWRDTETEVLLYEFKSDLNQYLGERRAHVRSLGDCIEFNRAHKGREMPFFQQELMEQAQEKGPLTDKKYKDALAKNRKLAGKDGIDAAVKKHKLDALVAPTSGPAWLTDYALGDRADSGCASPPAVSGYPHITVPAGEHFGLPVGISFFGSAWSEARLIALAYAFEQQTKARRKPDFRPTVRYPVS